MKYENLIGVVVLVAVSIFTIFAMSGCAGLNVQWVATATYNTPATTTTVMGPGVPVK